MNQMHAGSWFSGTTTERLALSARDGVFFHDTVYKGGTLFYAYGGEWYTLSGIDPLICSNAVPTGTIATGSEETLMFCTIPPEYLVPYAVVIVESSFIISNVGIDQFQLRLRSTSPTYDQVLYESAIKTNNGTGSFTLTARFTGVVNAGDPVSLIGSVVITSENIVVFADQTDFVGVSVHPYEYTDLYFTADITGTGNDDVVQRHMATFVYPPSGLYGYLYP